MRRLSLVFVLLCAACLARPVLVEPDPRTGQPARGRIAPSPVPAGAAQTCRETGRVACDVEGCGGPNLDRVTISCAGEPATTRCVANTRCTAR